MESPMLELKGTPHSKDPVLGEPRKPHTGRTPGLVDTGPESAQRVWHGEPSAPRLATPAANLDLN